jgi:hypothetical protein
VAFKITNPRPNNNPVDLHFVLIAPHRGSCF